jgi:hypothetical protein
MAKPQSTQRTIEIKKGDKELLGQVQVQPGHMEKISLGMYEQGMPAPSLTLELEPNLPDTISASLVRLDQGDHYTLVYQFQNFGDVTCRVRVRAE